MHAARLLLVLVVAGALLNSSHVAAQSNWSGSSAPTSGSGYDRYGQPIAPSANTPSITQRAQNAFSDTGSSMRDGVEAGIRAAEQTFGGNSATAASNNSVRSSGTSPWPSAPANGGTLPPVSTNGGWTSIGTGIAAPPLLIPQSPGTTANFGNANTGVTRTGQNYTAVAANDPPLHSVLADPSRTSPTSPTTTPDFSSPWGDTSNTSSATIGRGNSAPSSGSNLGSTVRDSGLVPLQTAGGAATADPRNAAGGRTADGWPGTDSSQQYAPTLGSPTGASISSNRPVSSPNTNAQQFGGNSQPVAQPNGQYATQSNAQMPYGQNNNANYSATGMNGTPNATQAGYGTNQMGNGTNQFGKNSTGTLGGPEAQPWMPLILSVLTLAGSLAANLYLGVSYLDARQKYQSLVRKTAETFRRVKAVAA